MSWSQTISKHGGATVAKPSPLLKAMKLFNDQVLCCQCYFCSLSVVFPMDFSEDLNLLRKGRLMPRFVRQ